MDLTMLAKYVNLDLDLLIPTPVESLLTAVFYVADEKQVRHCKLASPETQCLQ